MAITAATRTQLIGLSVAMLGQAPGTDRLNQWVADIDGDAMSVDDLANHIAESEAFQSEYPAFLTSMEFAEAFLGSVLPGLDEASMTEAVDIVSGMLDSGTSRGALALAVVNFLHDVADKGMEHDSYESFGMSAMTMANKIEVASHYTLNARMMDPSSDVLANVTADAESAAMAIEAIDNPPAPPMEPEMGQRFDLTPTIDNFTGGILDDTFNAEPIKGADGFFNATLNSFDSIDGGEGNDTIYIFGIEPRDTLRLGAEDISNVEHVVINTVGSINAVLSDWSGLEMVTLDRFGRDDEHMVEVIVDGAVVSTDRQFNGDVTIVGSMGAMNIEAGAGSDVHIGAAGHTTSVMVEGGASVTVDNGANKPSETVTTVSVDGVQRDLGSNGVRRGPGTKDGEGPKPNPGFDEDMPASSTNRMYLLENFDNEVVPHPVVGDGGTITWYESKGKYDDEKGKGDDGNLSQVELNDADAAQVAYDKLTTNDPDSAEQVTTQTEITGDDDGVSVSIHSNAIESVHLGNNDAIVLVVNNSMVEDEDGKMKASPEDLAVSVDGYGKNVPGAVEGKLCLDGAGSAENISIEVVDDSNFALASNTVKALSIMGDGKLTLDVNKFKDGVPDDGASLTLGTVTVAGETGLTMNMHGHHKLQSVDASGSSGDNNLSSYDPEDKMKDSTMLRSLEMVTTGSGKDSVSLNAGGVTGKLEMVNTGDGADSVTIEGAHRAAGLAVDLGAGNDTYSSGSDNKNSRIDAGEGMDTLHLTHGSGATYRGEDKMLKSVYENFEKLDVSNGTGTYDLALLGISSGDVTIRYGSTVDVDLKNMSDGMGISVTGKKGSASSKPMYGTVAAVDHIIADRQAGESRYSGDLQVTLVANGFKDSTERTTGKVDLTLTPDKDTGTLDVTSNANANANTGVVGLSAAHYQNKITITNGNDADGLEEIFVGGNAGLMIAATRAADLSTLELLDASANGGGVVFNAAEIGGTGELELYGGSGVDTLHAADGRANTISGGGAGDMLTAGNGNDTFEYGSASESQLKYKANGDLDTKGVDTITGFAGGTTDDVISLGRSLYRSLEGAIKSSSVVPVADSWMITDADSDTVTNAQGATVERTDNNSLQVFIQNRADGFFETTTPTSNGFGGSTNHHSVALVQDLVDGDSTGAGTVHWLFIDVDGDGDFSVENDMVIKLAGLTESLIANGTNSDFGS